jgi:hypothetical protein
MLKEFISTQTAFNKSVEEKLGSLGQRCNVCSKRAQQPLRHGVKPAPDGQEKKQIWRVKPVQTSQKKFIAPTKLVWVPKKKKEGDDSGNSLATTPAAVSPPSSVTSPAPTTHQPEAPLLGDSATMATFPVNPLAFLPDGMPIDQGPLDRKVRTDLVVPAIAPLQNDRVLIAETNRFIPIHLRETMREDIRDMLVEAGHLVRLYDDHPFGIGVYTFRDTLTADTVSGLTFQLDEITTITFVKHDEAKNMRLTAFGRETWLLYLGFPLNYQTTCIISSAVEDFGLLSI